MNVNTAGEWCGEFTQNNNYDYYNYNNPQMNDINHNNLVNPYGTYASDKNVYQNGYIEPYHAPAPDICPLRQAPVQAIENTEFYPEPMPTYPPCQATAQPFNFAQCFGFYGDAPCQYINIIDMEDFM